MEKEWILGEGKWGGLDGLEGGEFVVRIFCIRDEWKKLGVF